MKRYFDEEKHVITFKKLVLNMVYYFIMILLFLTMGYVLFIERFDCVMFFAILITLSIVYQENIVKLLMRISIKKD